LIGQGIGVDSRIASVIRHHGARQLWLDSTAEMSEPKEELEDKPDRARRRLMQLAAYVPAGIVSLTAARAHAGRADVTGTVKSSSSSSVSVKGS
jgi:hypothetical protein